MTIKRRIGTSHFASRGHAVAYFKQYGYDVPSIDAKLRTREIAVGVPLKQRSSDVVFTDGDGRYHIECEEL